MSLFKDGFIHSVILFTNTEHKPWAICGDGDWGHKDKEDTDPVPTARCRRPATWPMKQEGVIRAITDISTRFRCFQRGRESVGRAKKRLSRKGSKGESTSVRGASTGSEGLG